jgi:DNA-directed RNA polymerase subunit E'/Rpb7
MTKIFKKYKITTLINLSILDFSNTTIDDAVLHKMKDKYENKVSKYGYIKELTIIKRSGGIAMKEHFNSSFQFRAVCCALICNPSIDTILKAVIVSSNNAGFKGEVKDNDKVIIDVIIPKLTAGIKHEINNDKVEQLNNGEEVFIKICRKRYHYNDTKIVVIGILVNDPSITTVDQDNDDDIVVDTIKGGNIVEEVDDDYEGNDSNDENLNDEDDNDSIINLIDNQNEDNDEYFDEEEFKEEDDDEDGAFEYEEDD